MAKQLQLRRGTSAQHSTFTGAVGEVTIDTDKDVVVVHDGATAGGFPSQKQLVSGTNIKTINNTSLLGSGDISIIQTISVANIDELKDFVAPYNNYALNVLGYSEAGDGGGGLFYYDANSTEADNGGTVIEPTSGNGRWIRQYEGAVNVTWFGAVDGQDSTVAIQQAFALGKDVYMQSNHTYYISSYISVNSNTTVIMDSTIIRKRSDLAGIGQEFYPSGFDFDKKENVLFRGSGTISDENLLTYSDSLFPLNGNSIYEGYCPSVHVRSCTNVKIKDIKLYKVAFGIAVGRSDSAYYINWLLNPYPEMSYNCHVEGIDARFCGYFGANLNSCKNSSISKSYVYRAGDGGIFVQFCSQCSLFDNFRESPYGTGADISNILSINDVQGITVENSHDIKVYGNTLKGFYNGIQVINNATDVSITNNTIYESQAYAIAARGGDSIYGMNSDIKISDNLIINCGYCHTSNTTLVNHPFKGAIYIDDTYQAIISNNTISGMNSTYAECPIRAKGLEISDLGHWGSFTVEKRMSYSSLVIENNTVIFNQYRTNYTDYTGFEASDCNSSGIKCTGIWGKLSIDGNNLLANAFADGRYSAYLSLAGIEVSATGSGTGEAMIHSLNISNNTISYWNGGGIYVNIDNAYFFKAASVSIQGNNLNNLPGYGMYLTNLNYSNISNNTLKNIGKVNTSSGYDKAITLLNVYGALVDGNSVSNTEGITAMYGYVNCLYIDATLLYEGSNFFQKGTGDTTTYITLVNGSNWQSSLNTTAITSSNATGKYIKFGDGTMITTQVVTSNAPNSASGNLYTCSPLNVTFPVAFVGNSPSVSCSSTWITAFRTDSVTNGFLWVYTTSSFAYGVYVTITAIGRWK